MQTTQATGLLTTILGAVSQFMGSLGGLWTTLDRYILSHLGPMGQWAFWAFCAITLLIIAAFAARLVFKIGQWVVVPSAILSIAGITLAPSISPLHTFPVFLGVTTFVMLVRGR